MAKKKKELIQSYLVTSAKYDFSIYQKRILYRVVELIQAELKGKEIGKGITIEPTLYGDRWITMPIANFLQGEEDKNHYQIKKAFTRLNRLSVEFEDDESWEVFCVVKSAKLLKSNSLVRFQIAETLYKNLLNFSKGFNQYELQIAFDFTSQYSMRFYEMISRASVPSLTYTIDKLKEIFALEDKYKLPANFFKKVVDVAQKEIQKSKSPYYFTYEKIKHGRSFNAVKLNIHYRPEYDQKVVQKTSIRWDVNPRFLQLLNESLATKDSDWNAPSNRELIKSISQKISNGKIEYDEVKGVLRKAQKAKNKVGYTINAFKKLDKE